MKVFILLISTLAVVQSRPQNSPQTSDPSVELEKQTLIEVTPNFRRHSDNSAHSSQRKIEDNTKEILDKIAEVNKKHGLKPRKQTPNYFHFPFSYSRSQDENRSHETKNDNFKFTNSPFSNPIFEYLERERHGEENNQAGNDLSTNRQAQDYDEFQGYEKTVTNPEVAGITKEDIIPGQYIKRKIVHQQTFLIPNPNLLPPSPNSMISQNLPPYIMQTPMNFQQVMPIQPSPPTHNEDKYSPNKTGDKKDLSNLEKQTVDNIKNIVSNTQMLQSQPYPYSFNPYNQYPQGNLQGQFQYDFLAPNAGLEQQNEHNYRIYGPYTIPNSDKSRQNWNWPGANYFPIYIRDPFLQMYNAITSMIEYGPNAGQANPCNRPNKNKGKGREETLTREGKIADKYNEKEQITLELGDKTASSQITIYGVESDDPDKNNTSYLNIENIDIGANKENNLKFTVSLTTEARTGKETDNKAPQWDKVKQSGRFNSSRPASKLEMFENSKDFRPTSLFKPQPKPQPPPQTQTPAQTEAQLQAVKRPVVSPPIRPGDEFDDEIDEDDKADEVSISNDGNKKLFSRDNTGSGIFIHKLKVRKGGVAIAGPGGIATAGSGGTAIVGPNGVAYTHPDSLAIAGSGTKVVAVDPNINLGDLINSSINNKTSAAGFPPSRIGKVVAVGPVVYYNKGKPEKVTIIPFYGGAKGQVLQIVESPDGKVTTTILKRPANYSEKPEDVTINAADLENPPLPSKYDSDEFGSHIRNIQKTALRVIGLQEIAKQKGKLSENEEAIYKENMDALSQSAQNLAKIQEESNPFDFQSREGLSAWFERKATSNKDKNKKKQEEEKRKKEEEERKKMEEERKKKEEEEKKREEEKRKEEEEKRKEEEEKRKEEEKEEEIDDEDSIAINLPPEDASVAEAKPVGLAVAGEGGVAASKPIATAVVGPGGLAIARPVGTAIAGVSPDQALVPIYADGYIAGTKPKGSGTKLDSASQFLSRLISKYHQN